MSQHRYTRVLSVYPTRTGFAYAVVETRRGLIDWGTIVLGENTDREFSRRVFLEVERCRVTTVVLEKQHHFRRGERAVRRLRMLHRMLSTSPIMRMFASGEEIRVGLGLSRSATKHDVAAKLCELHPELSPQMPRKSVWRRDARMNVFDAVAIAFAAKGSLDRTEA